MQNNVVASNRCLEAKHFDSRHNKVDIILFAGAYKHIYVKLKVKIESDRYILFHDLQVARLPNALLMKSRKTFIARAQNAYLRKQF